MPGCSTRPQLQLDFTRWPSITRTISLCAFRNIEGATVFVDLGGCWSESDCPRCRVYRSSYFSLTKCAGSGSWPPATRSSQSTETNVKRILAVASVSQNPIMRFLLVSGRSSYSRVGRTLLLQRTLGRPRRNTSQPSNNSGRRDPESLSN